MQINTSGDVPVATIDTEAQKLAQNAQHHILMAQKYTCESRAEFLVGADSLKIVKGVAKALEDKRISVTGPLNNVIKTINDWFRAPGDACRQAEKIYKDAMGAFEAKERRLLAEQRAEADRKARLEREERERRAAKAVERGNTERAAQLLVAAADVQPAKADLAPVKAAGMSFGEAFEFEIIDPELIPREFMIVDTAKIGRQVKLDKNVELSMRKIPGIRVWSRPQVGARAAR